MSLGSCEVYTIFGKRFQTFRQTEAELVQYCRALPGWKAVGIVSVLMETETARPTVARNAAKPGHYGEQKQS